MASSRRVDRTADAASACFAVAMSLAPPPGAVKAVRYRLGRALARPNSHEHRRYVGSRFRSTPTYEEGLLKKPPEPAHRRHAAELAGEPVERAPQHRLVAVHDRLAERQLDVLDRLDLAGIGAAQEITVDIV